MDKTGLIFDIKEFAVFDGPGIRTTVFFKGCPLHCRWCHNPEGMSFHKQLMVSNNGCLHCGKCREACEYGGAENCRLCGKCVSVCPVRLRKICGTDYTVKKLAELLRKDKDFFDHNQGGVTFSGGEPLAQPEFLLELVNELPDIHKAIETSGYCPSDIFKQIVDGLDFIMMDIKLADNAKHKEYTGVSNEIILQNLNYLKKCGKPFVIRIPLIPGVNDTKENLSATARLLTGSNNLRKVELLPYHVTAGAKYEMVGRVYQPGFDTGKKPDTDCSPFAELEIPCTVI